MLAVAFSNDARHWAGITRACQGRCLLRQVPHPGFRVAGSTLPDARGIWLSLDGGGDNIMAFTLLARRAHAD